MSNLLFYNIIISLKFRTYSRFFLILNLMWIDCPVMLFCIPMEIALYAENVHTETEAPILKASRLIPN